MCDVLSRLSAFSGSRSSRSDQSLRHTGHDVPSCTTRNSRSLCGGRLTFLPPDWTYQSSADSLLTSILKHSCPFFVSICSCFHTLDELSSCDRASFAALQKPFVFHICSLFRHALVVFNSCSMMSRFCAACHFLYHQCWPVINMSNLIKWHWIWRSENYQIVRPVTCESLWTCFHLFNNIKQSKQNGQIKRNLISVIILYLISL